jgi:hypothetical protein
MVQILIGQQYGRVDHRDDVASHLNDTTYKRPAATRGTALLRAPSYALLSLQVASLDDCDRALLPLAAALSAVCHTRSETGAAAGLPVLDPNNLPSVCAVQQWYVVCVCCMLKPAH